MIRKLVALLAILLLAACHSSQTVVRNNKPYQRPRTVASKTRTVPPRKPVASRAGTPQRTSNDPTIRKIEQTYDAAKEKGKSDGTTTVYSKDQILEATTRVKVTTAMVLDYIQTYKDIAQNNMAQYGIPASIILGQGILESGAGTGPLSVLANNHFGIKCHKEWEGPTILYDDDAAQECFRKYDQPAQSYQDHSLFLTSRTRYASLFELEKGDYVSWAQGLKAAGYATDPKYPEKLIGIIERYNLKQYDTQVMGTPFVQDVAEPKVDQASVYEVVQGDTLYSISKRFNISIDDLKRKNNIQDNAISIGQSLKVH